MIWIYLLPVETVNGTDVIAGSDLIHDALIETTDDPGIRKLIMDTTSDENLQLYSVAIDERLPTPEELDAYNTQVIIEPPNPDVVRAEEILNSNPANIPMPELIELLHIIGRRLGFRV